MNTVTDVGKLSFLASRSFSTTALAMAMHRLAFVFFSSNCWWRCSDIPRCLCRGGVEENARTSRGGIKTPIISTGTAKPVLPGGAPSYVFGSTMTNHEPASPLAARGFGPPGLCLVSRLRKTSFVVTNHSHVHMGVCRKPALCYGRFGF